MNQTTGTLFMVRPSHFGFNPETAATNRFQSEAGIEGAARKAASEFEAVVIRLHAEGIETIILNDDPGAATPDAVFPNNWVSFHHTGQVIIYPMMNPSRRRERRPELIAELMERHGLDVNELAHLTSFESSGKFLEGTGSVVFDHTRRIAYAAKSPRTHPEPLKKLCGILGYRPHVFETYTPDRQPVYHTNVVMSLGNRFCVLCADLISDEDQRRNLQEELDASGHELITVTAEQMASFACNLLEVKNRKNDPFILISETAIRVLSTAQRKKLESRGILLPFALPVIETLGGGSIRCMVSEVFLPTKSGKNGITISKSPDAVQMEQLFALRWKVLRAPWNQPHGSEKDDQELQATQFIAAGPDGKVAGTGRLQQTAPGTGQIRYMAVDPNFQGKGIGRLLIRAMESEARSMGMTRLFLQARENAIPFYHAMGYEITEKSFVLYNSIQHYRMERTI
jgi:N-acetylglutamate synthase-like GNAT family acetyltransferase